MLRGRGRLPALAEVAGPQEDGAWSLRRSDFTALEGLLPRLEQPRVVAVVGEGEAAAVAAISIAATAAARGRRTILVDCDLAQPRLAAQLGLDSGPGLHEYLRWEAEPRQVLQPLALAGAAAAGSTEPLVCVCGGRPASKAETLLGLQSFSHMIEKLRVAYELVLLVAPPVASEAAACRAVAACASVVVAGLSAEAASGRDSRAVRAAVRRLPTSALGVIVVAA